MEDEKTMKCPFRQDESGEFGDCYKKRCMAYAEISIHIACLGGKENSLTVCKRITQMPQQYPASVPFDRQPFNFN